MYKPNKFVSLAFVLGVAASSVYPTPAMAVLSTMPIMPQPPSGPFPKLPWTSPAQKVPDTQKEEPTPQPREEPREQPRDQPKDQPKEQPKDQPGEMPKSKDQPTVPGDLPKEQPHEQPQPAPEPKPGPRPLPRPEPAPQSHDRPWNDAKPDYPL